MKPDLVLAIVSLLLAWLCLSTFRFQVYGIFAEIEESLRRFCVQLNNLGGWLEILKEQGAELSDQSVVALIRDTALEMRQSIPGGISFYGGQEIRDLKLILMEQSHEVTALDQEDSLALVAAKTKADRILGACRDEKKKLEGCFKGNFWCLYLLAARKPLSTSMVMAKITKRANDPSEALDWTGSLSVDHHNEDAPR